MPRLILVCCLSLCKTSNICLCLNTNEACSPVEVCPKIDICLHSRLFYRCLEQICRIYEILGIVPLYPKFNAVRHPYIQYSRTGLHSRPDYILIPLFVYITSVQPSGRAHAKRRSSEQCRGRGASVHEYHGALMLRRHCRPSRQLALLRPLLRRPCPSY